MNADGETPVFARRDWVAAGVVAFASLSFYTATLAPTVTLEQSGAFVVAAEYFGIGRVPGYPLWHLFGKFFTSVFWFVRYRGQSNPAWATNFMSAFFGALSCGLVSLIVSSAGKHLVRNEQTGGNSNSFKPVIAGMIAAAMFAVSPVMWSQSTITETHTLTLFMFLLFMAVGLKWIFGGMPSMAYVLAAVWGLGWAQSHILLLLLPAYLLILLLNDKALFRDTFAAGTVVTAVIGIMSLAAIPPHASFPKVELVSWSLNNWNPEHIQRWAVLLFGTILLPLGCGLVKTDEDNAGTAPFMLICLCAGGVALLLGLGTIPTLPPVPDFHGVFAWRAYYYRFVAVVLAIIVFGFFFRRGRMFAAAALSVVVTLALMVRQGALLSLVHPLMPWFWYYIALNVTLLVLAWITLPRGRTVAISILLIEMGLLFYAVCALGSDLGTPMQFAYPRTWEGFKHMITRGQYERIILADVFGHPKVFVDQLCDYVGELREQFRWPLGVFALLPLAIVFRCRGMILRWLSVCLLAFFMFSVVMLIGANPRGDIQDAFIQRTKFIPSYALWSILAGYGIVVLLDLSERLLHRKTEKHQPTHKVQSA